MLSAGGCQDRGAEKFFGKIIKTFLLWKVASRRAVARWKICINFSFFKNPLQKLGYWEIADISTTIRVTGRLSLLQLDPAEIYLTGVGLLLCESLEEKEENQFHSWKSGIWLLIRQEVGSRESAASGGGMPRCSRLHKNPFYMAPGGASSANTETRGVRWPSDWRWHRLLSHAIPTWATMTSDDGCPIFGRAGRLRALKQVGGQNNDTALDPLLIILLTVAPPFTLPPSCCIFHCTGTSPVQENAS